METKKEVLKRILATELLGESVGKIAATLGLKSKSTLYRMLNDSATEKTAEKVMDLIEKHLDIAEEEMRMFSVMLHKYEYFNDVMKMEKHRQSPENVVADIIARDYSHFSQNFRESMVPALDLVRERDRTCFYNVLFYYYVKKSCHTFYRRGMTHQERCMSLITPLAEALQRRFPENIKSTGLIEVYNNPKQGYYTMYPPMLCICILMGHNLLEMFDKPQQSLVTDDCQQLPGTSERTYWVNKEHTKALLAIFCKTDRERHGYYGIYSIDARDKDLHFECLLKTFNDNSVGLQEPDNTVHLGKGYLEEDRWIIVWDDKGRDALGMGDVWEMADLSKSDSLTAFDRNLTDEKMSMIILRENGLEFLYGYEIADVMVSRHEVTILLMSGKKLVADKSAYIFFDTLSPDDPVLIAKSKRNGIDYVIWGDMNHMVPLTAFRVEE